MSDHKCHPGLRNSSWGQSGLLGEFWFMQELPRQRGKLGSPHVCARAPGEPAVPTEAPGTRRFTPAHL